MTEPRRILVTGAFGYVGLALLRRLARDGFEPVAFGHAPRSDAARAVIPEGARVVVGELERVAEALDAHGPFYGVCHLAGGGGPAKCAADPVAAVRVNVRGTIELAAAARQAGVRRALFASTIAVYGAQRDMGRPYRESDEALPDELYGAVKETAERAWSEVVGGTSLRLANIYGAGAGVDLGIQGAVERFARAAATGGTITTFGGGAQRIDYVHVDDVAGAFSLALGAAELPAVLNVGGGDPIAIGELARRCVAIGRARGTEATVEDKPAPPGKSWPDRSLAIDRAREVLGWHPRVTYDDGLAELVEMMARAGAAAAPA